MKKSNKKLLVVAIATALTAASAGSALALENQFSGAFTAFFDNSNYSAAGNNAYEAAPTNLRGLKDGAPTENYFVQRVRLGYTAKADDHVKLVTKFEFDYNWYGNSSYATNRGSGGAIGSDSVNMETKHLYLDLNYPLVNAKIGMMPNNDIFKGILFDADMAGILFSHNYTNAGVNLGFFRWNDDWDWTNNKTLGKNTVDMFQLDGKYNVSKDLKVGAAYYYVKDDFNLAKVHTVGLNAETTLGPVAVNAFAVKQFGDLNATDDAKGYAFNVGAKMPVGKGTARAEVLYVSGGDNAFYNAANGTEAGGYYDSEMIFLARDKNATTIDNAIVYDVSNYGQGVILGAIGYDYPFTDKLSGSANIGFGAIADDKFSQSTGDSDYLGTEINAEVNYQLSANVSLGARAGYLMLGKYFDGVDAGRDADNPYDVKILARYSF
ncbi:porin [Geomonas paludis]|uniref:Porin n=1 Tax=Geomonas paludis TaxID=2740185 RepID=A0ABY4LJK0_9BACT|nr:porin [Geomonas paludis]UPU37924.1 porin [Geomonas paludis]